MLHCCAYRELEACNDKSLILAIFKNSEPASKTRPVPPSLHICPGASS